MPSRQIPSELNQGTYYLTLTVERWYYLFDRYNRWQILADSLRFCQEHKGLEFNSYVFLLNHLHLIATSPDVAGFIRDFKPFTSKSAACDGIIALLTDNSINVNTTGITSQWIAADIGASRATGKFVIPLLIGKNLTIPALINDLFALRENTLDSTTVEKVADAIDNRYP
jgi:hypothetical protein